MQLVSSIALLVGTAPFQGARGRERSCQDTEPRRTSPRDVGKCNDPSLGPRRAAPRALLLTGRLLVLLWKYYGFGTVDKEIFRIIWDML